MIGKKKMMRCFERSEKRCGVDDDEDDDESDANGAYLSSVNRITQITMERAVRPWLRAAWLFGLSALGRENGRCVDTLHAFTNGVIARRRRQPRRAAPDGQFRAFRLGVVTFFF